MEARSARTSTVETRRRGPFQGTLQIVRFNLGFYLVGLAVVVGGLTALHWISMPTWLRAVMGIGLGFAAWWWLASLVVSYWVYDASGLMAWRWLEKVIGERPVTWINLHAGLDESTPELAAAWGSPVAVYDFFDPTEMTEPSIHIARHLSRNAIPPLLVPYDKLPLGDGAVSLACVLFAAHELRSPQAREALFSELFRVLLPGGRLAVVEHVRDVANFVAFGPGFMHFMPRKEWLRLGSRAGFRLVAERRKTPFAITLVMEKP